MERETDNRPVCKHPHRNLEAWKQSMDLVETIYNVTMKFPQHELYGLTSQLRRAAIAVPSNISEGATGRTNAHFSSYLVTAIGSLSELDTQVELAFRLAYITHKEFEEISRKVDSCKALVFGLKKSLLKRP